MVAFHLTYSWSSACPCLWVSACLRGGVCECARVFGCLRALISLYRCLNGNIDMLPGYGRAVWRTPLTLR